MKKMIALMAALLTAQPTSAAPQTEYPVFSFKGMDTETTRDMKSLLDAGCKQDTEDTVNCSLAVLNLGGEPLNGLVISFYRGKLYGLIGSLPQSSYLNLSKSFAAKYGEPDLAASKWIGKDGKPSDTPMAVWHFRGGDLRLIMVANDKNESAFVFISLPNSPPALTPTVDF